MQCPHCDRTLSFGERQVRRCSGCEQQFAFDPQSHPLGLNDLRFNRAIKGISCNGTLFYTVSQLQYHLHRKKIAEQQLAADLTTSSFICAHQVMEPDQFIRDVIECWCAVYGMPQCLITDLVSDSDRSLRSIATPSDDRPPVPFQAVLACPQREIL